MEDPKKQVARYLRTQYTLPVDASDEDVIRYARAESPEELGEIEKQAYSKYKVDVEPKVEDKKKSLLERGMQKLDSLGTSFNQSVEDIANVDKNDKPGDSYQPHDVADSAIILGAKALRTTGEVGKVVGELGDAGTETINKQIDTLPNGVKQFVKYNPMLQGPKVLYNAASMMAPRTSMQAAFAVLTSLSEIKAMGSDIMKAGKGLAARAASQAETTAMGAIRTPAELYPESRLAQTLERLFRGTDGEGRFGIVNKSKVNAETQAIGKLHIADMELADGAKQEAQIVEKLKHDVGELQGQQTNFLSSSEKQQAGVLKAAELKKNKLSSDMTSSLDQNGKTLEQLEISASENAEALVKAQKSKEAASSALKADLAVDKALGLLDKDSAGVQVGRQLDYAKGEAYLAVDNAYNKAHALGKLVKADTSQLNTTFSKLRKDLTSKLKVNPEDTRAQKILGILEEGTETSMISDEGIESLQGSLSKSVRKAADEKAVQKSKTLSDLMTLYSDLNVMGREKGDAVYTNAADEVRAIIRQHEEVPWTKAVIDAWDSARGTRMHLDQAFENNTVSSLLKTAKEGKPAQLFAELFDKESRIPLTRFMLAAPEEAKLIVRRESLGRGLLAVDNLSGKAVDNLNKFIETVGAGNIEILHAGQDLHTLRGLAEANDAVHAANKAAPGIKAQVATVIESNGKLIRDWAKKLDHTNAALERISTSAKKAVANNKVKVFEETKRLDDAARFDIRATREKTVERISASIDELEKAFAVRAKPSGRIGEAGKVVIDTMRSDDDNSSTMLGAGVGGLVLAQGADMVGMKGTSNAIRGIAGVSIAAGLVKKSPKVMSNLYYSDKGRALMQRIASAPSSKEAAIALLELGNAIKNPALYLLVRPKMNDKAPIKEELPVKSSKPGLGKLEGLRGRNAQEASLLNEPNGLPQTPEPEEPIPSSQEDDDTYQYPVR